MSKPFFIAIFCVNSNVLCKEYYKTVQMHKSNLNAKRNGSNFFFGFCLYQTQMRASTEHPRAPKTKTGSVVNIPNCLFKYNILHTLS